MLEASEILFLGIGKSAVLWYRCALPAMHIGADWCGIQGRPPHTQVVTGIVKSDTALPRYDDYKVVIVQQPYGREWFKQIKSLRERGIKVLYEVDDYLHGVRSQQHHDFARFYSKSVLAQHELCMRACDGLVCSTDYIARRYAKFNRNVYICRNGLDVQRYELTRPKRSTVNILWAGATGHVQPLVPWLNAMLPVMQRHEETCFVSVGNPALAQPLQQLLGPQRAIGIPFAPLECYPAAMTMGDIALAPAIDTSWYRGKSDLRWLEAAALGMPVIADPEVYPEIEHGVTGFQASSPADAAEILAELVIDHELRDRVGNAAREYVETQRTSDIAAAQWFEVCSAVVGDYESVSQLRRAGRK